MHDSILVGDVSYPLLPYLAFDNNQEALVTIDDVDTNQKLVDQGIHGYICDGSIVLNSGTGEQPFGVLLNAPEFLIVNLLEKEKLLLAGCGGNRVVWACDASVVFKG